MSKYFPDKHKHSSRCDLCGKRPTELYNDDRGFWVYRHCKQCTYEQYQNKEKKRGRWVNFIYVNVFLLPLMLAPSSALTIHTEDGILIYRIIILFFYLLLSIYSFTKIQRK